MNDIETLVGQLGSDDQAQDFAAYRQLLVLVSEAGTPGSNDRRAEIARELATALTASNEHQDDRGNKSYSPKYSVAVRGRIARLLSKVAGDDEVPALKQSLESFDTREMARWALDRTTSPAATAVLISAATEGVGPEFRIGAIGALGRRTGTNVTAALQKCAEDDDLEVRLAALEALSNLADPSSDRLYATLLEATRPSRARGRAIKARLRLAAQLAAADHRAEAQRIYEATAASQAEEPQLAAARRALDGLN